MGEKCDHDADLEVVVSNCGVSSSGVPGGGTLGGGGGGKAGVGGLEDGIGPPTLTRFDGSAPAEAARSGGPDAIGEGTIETCGAGAYDLLRYGGGDFDGGERLDATG